MPEQLVSLREFMKSLAAEWGEEGKPAKYKTIAERFGTTTTTVGSLMSGLPSKRETTRDFADNARISRVAFLRASGYRALDEDIEYDQREYGIEPTGNKLSEEEVREKAVLLVMEEISVSRRAAEAIIASMRIVFEEDGTAYFVPKQEAP